MVKRISRNRLASPGRTSSTPKSLPRRSPRTVWVFRPAKALPSRKSALRARYGWSCGLEKNPFGQPREPENREQTEAERGAITSPRDFR